MSAEVAGNKEYVTLLGSIKERIRTSQIRAAVKVNQELLALYWFIGEALSAREAEWGSKFIETLARDLKVEFPDMKGFSKRNLEDMRRWYVFHNQNIEFAQQAVAQLQETPEIQIAQQAVAQFGQQAVDPNLAALLFNIPWGHHTVILTKANTPQEAYFYIIKTIQNNWSRSILQSQIESKLFERQGKALTNFQLTLPKPQSDLAQETIKSEYNFDFLSLTEEMKERDLELGLIDHIRKFLLELGKGFAYVGNQYNLNVEGDDFFLDLLFFNYRLNRFVIFELKVGDFKPEFAGKLNMYINTVNKQVKLPDHADTIGVLLCKTPNKSVIELSMMGMGAPMGVAEYKLTKELKTAMPSKKELEAELNKQPTAPTSPAISEKLNRIQELIKKSGKKPVTVKRNKELEEKLYDSFYVELVNAINKELDKNGVNTMFESSREQFTSNQERNKTINALRESYSTADSLPSNLGYEKSLLGFKAAGTKAFNQNISFEIELQDYKYQLTIKHRSVCLDEWLYDETIPKQKIQELAEYFVEDLLESIEKQLERNIES